MVERGTSGPDSPVELSMMASRGGVRPSEPGGDVMAAPPAPRRRWARVIALLLAGFVLGWGVGYDQGIEDAPAGNSAGPPGPAGTTAPAAGGGVAGLRATGERCAVQIGTQLWLGLELVNSGPGRIVLRRVRINLPLGGLEETSVLLGACGQLEALDAEQDAGGNPEAEVDGSATAWVSGIFDVIEDECPAPYPVQFLVDYTDPAGGNYAVASGSFNDLGDVDYSAC
jgi:hypothetical protein